jgi:L-alanine-DL-glutamate epimerase-like enolase superfamily enzyme
MAKVTELQAHLLSSVFPEPYVIRFSNGERRIYKHDFLLVKVISTQGICGYASAPPSPNISQLINRNLRSAIINLDLNRIEPLRKRVLEKRPPFPGLPQAFGAVEIALYDLKGKLEERPVSDLLGIRTRERLRLMANLAIPLEPQDAAAEARRQTDKGYKRIMVHLGLSPEKDLETIRLLKRELTEERKVDVHGEAWWMTERRDYATLWIEDFLGSLSPAHFRRVVEPFPASNPEVYRRLAAQGRVMPAVGGRESSLSGLASLAASLSVSSLQVNFGHLGGYGSMREVIRFLAERKFTASFIAGNTPLDVVCVAHLAATNDLEITTEIEVPVTFSGEATTHPRSALSEEMLKAPLMFDDGELIVPAAPGLGVEIDDTIIRKFPWKSGPASIFTVKEEC